MTYINNPIAQQGWQCPVCRAINAPWKGQCGCHNSQTQTWPGTVPNVPNFPQPYSVPPFPGPTLISTSENGVSPGMQMLYETNNDPDGVGNYRG